MPSCLKQEQRSSTHSMILLPAGLHNIDLTAQVVMLHIAADDLPLQHEIWCPHSSCLGSAAAYLTHGTLAPNSLTGTLSLQDEIMTMYFPELHKGAIVTPGQLASGTSMAAE